MAREQITVNGRPVTNPKAQAGIKLFLGLVMLAVGGGLMAVRHVTLRDIHAARDWQTRPCIIQRAEYARDDEGGRYLVIEYQYQFDGVTYHGDRLDLMPGQAGDDGPWEEQLLAANPPGTEGTCYVDPRQPDRAVLDRDHGVAGTGNLRLLAFPFLFAGAAMCFSVAVSWTSGKAKTRGHRRRSSRHAPELSARPRRLGIGQTVAFSVSTRPMIQIAWAFFVGFSFVFTMFDGPAAMRDLWPANRRQLPGEITRVEPLDQFEFGQRVYEFQFRFDAEGQPRTSTSNAVGRQFEVGDAVQVVFDPDRPDAATIAGARRRVVPLWVLAIPMLVVLVLGLGIVGSYVFNLRSLSLLRGGVLAVARRRDIATSAVAPRGEDSLKAHSGYVFDVDDETYAVDPRSRAPADAATVVVLCDPLRPSRNLALSMREQSVLAGERSPWLHAAAGLLVPVVCLAALAWLWGWF